MLIKWGENVKVLRQCKYIGHFLINPFKCGEARSTLGWGLHALINHRTRLVGFAYKESLSKCAVRYMGISLQQPVPPVSAHRSAKPGVSLRGLRFDIYWSTDIHPKVDWFGRDLTSINSMVRVQCAWFWPFLNTTPLPLLWTMSGQ